MRSEDFTGITDRCFHGDPASCSFPCPFSFDVRTFLDRAKSGKWRLAYKLFRNAVIFPAIVCELCQAPCMKECQRAHIGDDVIAIRDIESASIRFAKKKDPENYRIPPKTERIAVIGAGLAGLSCALNLAQKQYSITIFEKESDVLFSLSNHPMIEKFREEITFQFSAVSVNYEFENEIKDLLELNEFDAVYISTGESGYGFSLADRADSTTGFVDELGDSLPGVFVGGGLVGMDAIQSIAFGLDVSKYIESFIQTGNPSRADDNPEWRKALNYVNHDGVESEPQVIPTLLTEDGKKVYTEEEAVAEASRCMSCDCRNCLDACDMLNSFSKRPQKIALEAFMDTRSNPPFSSCSLTREAYSCNICGRCKTVCPVDIDMGKVFQLARVGRAETGKHPTAFHDFWLRDFSFHNSIAASAPPIEVDGSKSYVFFPGCKLGDSNPDLVNKASAYLRDKIGAGFMLDCCGAPPFWAGEKEIFENHINKIKTLWEQFEKPIFVFACAYCIRLFKEYLPEIERISIYEIMAADEDFIIEKSPATMSVFDPCVSEEEEKMQQAVRLIVKNGGMTVSDLPEANRCCGFGGHMRTANQELYDKIVSNRNAEDENPYLVYCVNCAEALGVDGKECKHILELAFANDQKYGVPSLQEKRTNAANTRGLLMDLYNISAEEENIIENWESLRLEIPDEVLNYMNAKLIMENDIKEAIWTAEENGKMVIDEVAGIRQCYLAKSLVTYWAKYIKHGEENNEPIHYELISAYSHRMRFSEED